MFHRARSLVLVLLLALVAAACGGASTGEPTSTLVEPGAVTSSTAGASGGEGSATSVAESTTVPDETTTTAASPFPVTVVHDGGEITIAMRPERIVSLSPTHTEMLYAVGAGDQVIATDLFSDFPPEAQETIKLDAFNFDIEEIASLDPDLVIIAFDFQGESAALEEVGVPWMLLGPARTLEDAYRQVEIVGVATGHPDEGRKVAEAMRSEIETLLASVPRVDPPLTFYHEVDATLFAPNSSSFLGDIYRRVGLVNIADEVPDEFGSGFVQLAPEFILEKDPDLIFLGDAEFGESPETVAARPGWDTLTAVKEGRVFVVDGTLAGRWGPRTPELVRQIVEAVRSVVEG